MTIEGERVQKDFYQNLMPNIVDYGRDFENKELNGLQKTEVRDFEVKQGGVKSLRKKSVKGSIKTEESLLLIF